MLRRTQGALVLVALAAGLAGCFERGKKKAEPTEQPRAAKRWDGSPGAAFVAGSFRDPSGPAVDSATIRIALEAEPAHLDAMIAQDALATRLVLGDVFEGLLCREQPNQVAAVPCLADTYETSDDHRTWTFHLRAGVHFHDGKQLEAADVLHSVELARQPTSVLSAELDDLKTLTGTDRTLVFVFNEARAQRRGTFVRLPIVSASQSNQDRKRKPIGTGPLSLQTWVRSERISFVRFADYWGASAKAAQVSYRIFASRTQSLAALSAGEVDVVLQVPVDAAQRATRRGVAVFGYEMPAYLAAVYNLRRKPLADVETRRALTMLLDRSGLIETIFAGWGQPIVGPFLSFDPDLRGGPSPLPYDPARARAALAGQPLSAEILVPTESATMSRIADIWASDAREAATLRVARQPFVKVLERLRSGDFDIVLMAFSTSFDVDLYTRFHSSQNENYGGLEDDELDRLLTRARGVGFEQAQIKRDIARRVHELQPYTFIASDHRLGLVRAGVGGVLSAGPYSFARHLWRSRR